MGINAKVILDSIAPNGKRLTTFEVEYPRIILPEVLTHAALSRNTESSRAIPVSKRVRAVREDPFIPVWWGKNEPGMQAWEELDRATREQAEGIWRDLAEGACRGVEKLLELGLHKQIANRPIEPWVYIKQIITATEWGNLYALRTDEHAQPEFRVLAAEKMLVAHRASIPRPLRMGEWHLPYVQPEETGLPTEIALECSVARCARVSYRNHDGSHPLVEKDRSLFKDLLGPGHMSPFAHQGTPAATADVRSGNFVGFIQYRKTIPNENRSFPGF